MQAVGRAVLVRDPHRTGTCYERQLVLRPGTLERLRLGYDILSHINPGLVLIRISGYGQDGPYSQKAGYGAICEATAGVRDMTGDPDRPPSRVGLATTDYLTAVYAALGTAQYSEVSDSFFAQNACFSLSIALRAWSKKKAGQSSGSTSGFRRVANGAFLHTSGRNPLWAKSQNSL